MELNWKEDNNLVRKIAKILLGDTLPNGEPVIHWFFLTMLHGLNCSGGQI